MSYKATVLEDSPVSYWRLGEASGTTAADVQGVNAGTYKNAPTLGVTGALTGDSDTAARFAAASKQWVSVADSASLDFGDVVTYEAWVKRASIGTGQTILDKGSGSLIIRMLASNKLLVRRNGVANICESTATITDTTLSHHIVVTKNGATVKIYFDGVDVTGTVTNSTLANTAIVLGIGAADAGAEEWWNGSLDEVAVYNTALSKARVEAHFSAGVSLTIAVPPSLATASAPSPAPAVSVGATPAAGIASASSPTPVASLGTPAAGATAGAPAPAAAVSVGLPAAEATAMAPAPVPAVLIGAPAALATAAALAPQVVVEEAAIVLPTINVPSGLILDGWRPRVVLGGEASVVLDDRATGLNLADARASAALHASGAKAALVVPAGSLSLDDPNGTVDLDG